MTRSADFARVGEFPTHGVGPHELLLLGDGRTLAVANGGIETHPDFGRAKLNIADDEAVLRPGRPHHRRSGREARAAARTAPAFDPPHGHRRIPERSGSAASTRARQPNGRRWSAAPRAGKELELIDMPRRRSRPASATISARWPPTAAPGTVAVSSPQGNTLAVHRRRERQGRRDRGGSPKSAAWRPTGAGFLATTGTGDDRRRQTAEVGRGRRARLGQSPAQDQV